MTPGQLSFELHQQQFPVKLAFAMTINKSQGQPLGTVGIELCYSVFSHGQLYVSEELEQGSDSFRGAGDKKPNK